MLDRPEVLQIGAKKTVVISLVVPRAEIRQVMGPAIAEILAALSAQGLTPAGPLFSYHKKRPTEMFDFEVGFPVNTPIAAVGRVKMSELPAATIARSCYRGDYEGLAAAWGEFCAWLESESLPVQDSLWECYLVGPESGPDPDQWRTELNRPLVP